MSWGIVGLVASLVPWGVMLLGAASSLELPCRSAETAAIKGLCCVAVMLAVFGSVVDVRRRGVRMQSVAGLVLALAFALPLFISEPATVTAFTVPALVVLFTVVNWRQPK